MPESLDPRKLKWCNQCKTIKPPNEFYRDKSSKDGLCNRCKTCKRKYQKIYGEKHKEKINAYSREWRRKNSDHVIGHNLKCSYGITLEQYDKMFESQNGVCAICNRVNENNKRLHVDHCHNTGVVRGLLCSKCNIGLGQFEDSIEKLLSAAIYLEKS